MTYSQTSRRNKARRALCSEALRAFVPFTFVPILCGCRDLPAPAVEQLRQSERLYRLARYDESERLADAVIRAHPDKPDTAEAYYLRGLSRVQRGRRSAARADFQAALRLCERRELRVLLDRQIAYLGTDDASDGSGEYTIQCGAYSTLERAQAAADTLRRQGLDVQALRVGRGDAARYVVQTGRFRDHASAMAALGRVRRVQPDAFVSSGPE